MTTFMAIVRGKIKGPFTFEQLDWMEGTGEISKESHVCVPGGGSGWTTWALAKLGRVPKAPPALPPPIPTHTLAPSLPASRTSHYSRRLPTPTFREDGPPLSRIAYIILALFLGTIGIHNFYARRVGEGVGQIGLVILALVCLLAGVPVLALILLAAGGVWAIGDIIAVTRDGYDRDLV